MRFVRFAIRHTPVLGLFLLLCSPALAAPIPIGGLVTAGGAPAEGVAVALLPVASRHAAGELLLAGRAEPEAVAGGRSAHGLRRAVRDRGAWGRVLAAASRARPPGAGLRSGWLEPGVVRQIEAVPGALLFLQEGRLPLAATGEDGRAALVAPADDDLKLTAIDGEGRLGTWTLRVTAEDGRSWSVTAVVTAGDPVAVTLD